MSDGCSQAPAWHAGDFVFDRGDGQPFDPDTFSKAFRAAARGIGLDGVRLHDLRHGFTLGTYTHPSEDEAAAAMVEAGRLIGGVP